MPFRDRNKRLKRSHNAKCMASIDSFSSQIDHLEKLITPSEQFAFSLKEKLNGRHLENPEKESIISDLIRSYSLDDDPLQHWLDYIHFVKSDSCQHFLVKTLSMNAQNECIVIMKRCTFALLHHPKYANDERFIRIIVIYADSIQDAEYKESLFSLYFRLGVGIFSSILWTSWAFVMEKHYDHNAANIIYMKALEIKVEPRDIVLGRYRDFQHRARYYGISLEDTELTEGFSYLVGSTDFSDTRGFVNTSKNVAQNEKLLDTTFLRSEAGEKGSTHSQQQHPKKRKKSNPKQLSTSNSTTFTIYEDDEENQTDNDILSCKGFDVKQKSREIVGMHRVRNKHDNRYGSKDSFVCKHVIRSSNGLSFEEIRARLITDRVVTNGHNFNHLSRKKLDATQKSFEELRANSMSYTLFSNLNFNCCQRKEVVNYLSLHQKNMRNALLSLSKKKDLHGTNEDIHCSPFVAKINSNLPTGLMGNFKNNKTLCLANEEYIMLNKLGKGTFGTVILCSSSKHQIAVKVQKEVDSLAWEFEVLNKINNRLQSPHPSCLFPATTHLIAFSNGATMGLTAASSTGMNLLDVVNVYNCSVPEVLALHYTTRMLKHIETLHVSAKVLHCDLKPDNFVLTKSDECEFDIMLVDFGRAVDILDLKSGCLRGNIMVEGLQCGSMCLGTQWKYDLDCHGICVCSYTLLHGSYLEMEMDPVVKQWKLRKPFRRYWKKSLWQQLFTCLLNITPSISTHEYSLLLRKTRTAFEEYLSTDSIRSNLKSTLIQQRNLMTQRKK